MKRTLISMLTLLAVTAASADNYSYLAFQTADGSTRNIGVESLEMTFSDGKLMASNGTESLEISVADLTRMFFSSEATAIKDISLDKDSPVKGMRRKLRQHGGRVCQHGQGSVYSKRRKDNT